MNRDKVLELAREVWSAAGGTVYIGPSISQVEEFAYLVERELRGDAKPVGWQYYDEQSGKWVTGMNTNNHREHTQNAGYKTRDLYARPAPAVDAKPVARLRFYKGEVVVTKDYETVERNGEFDVYTHPAPTVVRQMVEALEELARLGNGDRYGNSLGNEIAQKALKKWMECQ